MLAEEYFKNLGGIFSNLLSIEFLMRVLIAQKEGEDSKFPDLHELSEGEEVPDPAGSLRLRSFSNVVDKFNKLFPREPVGGDVVRLRNALAHGMIVAKPPSPPCRLVKFEPPGEDPLVVSDSLDLTEEWAKESAAYTVKVLKRLGELHQKLGTGRRRRVG